MAVVNLLDKSIYALIAAGEVIARPASIVKELVENSIDAGATHLTIEVTRRELTIRVSDNGCGMEAQDLARAFVPHATSKISSAQDLDGILTLGFRGEALPSIASVAQVSAVSRTSDSQLGSAIVIRDSQILDHSDRGCPFGTSVLVEHIFDSVPARKKFLKSDSQELSAITATVEKLILANPLVAFRYLVDGRQVLSSGGQGVLEAIFAVYKQDFASKMMEIHSTMPDIVLYGYISQAGFSKPTRAYQTLVVNGRVVNDPMTSAVIAECYESYLMKRQYPAFVLYLELPPTQVDVNVHPEKLEVRFADRATLRQLLIGAVRGAIAKSAKLASTIVEQPPPAQAPLVREHIGTDLVNTYRLVSRLTPASESGVKEGGLWSGLLQTVATTPVAPVSESAPESTQESLLYSRDSTIVGKLFDTYIIVESGNCVYYIDQHAAHERLLFDRLCAQVDSGDLAVQQLLVPYTFELGEEDASLLDAKLAVFDKYGFAIEHFGDRTYRLTSVPVVCCGLDFAEFVDGIWLSLRGKNAVTRSSLLENNLKQIACKSAVKAHDDLSPSEIEHLIAEMQQQNVDLFCPHGRPIALRFAVGDIERWFRRQV